MSIDYEIIKISSIKLFLKDLLLKKPYYKIKNNTEKTITLHCVMKSTLIKQDYKKIGKQMKKSITDEYKLKTIAKFSQKIKKIVLGPNEKIKIFYKQLLPVYWINEETNKIYSITGFRAYDKIVFDEYEEEEEEEEMKCESKFVYEEDKEIIELTEQMSKMTI